MPPVQFTASLDNSLTDPRGYRALLSRLGRRQLPVLLLACAGIAAHPARGGTFEQDVAPILARSCAQCHSGENQASGFSVASLDAVFKGGARRGAAVIAGHPERSPLIQVLTGAVEPRMPLGGSLGPGEIDAISSWIRTLETHPIQQTQGGRDWFLTPVQSPQAPDVKDKTWPRTAIDAFVLAELEAKGLSPAPPAPARTLARRIHLDLVGLPPSADEMRQFLEDRLPGAYERLVERLLADPRYGERWARHWLDLVRYGETGGLEGDGAIGNAWRYRDWVIQALNDDMPYDEFVVMQIAGADEQSKTRNNYVPDAQGFIPAGFLRLAPWDRSNLVAAEVRQNYLNEVTTATASIFLGLTLGCARCHDHKYDPLPMRDFYRFQSFFSAVQTEDRHSAVSRPEVPYADPALAKIAAAKIAKYEKRLEDGPEKRALEELEERLRQRLIEVRRNERRGKDPGQADLHLELRREDGRIFSGPARRLHARLLAAAKRTGDPEEQQALEAYESHLLEGLKQAYGADEGYAEGRFDALSATDVREAVRAAYAADRPFSQEEVDQHSQLSGLLDVYRRRLSRWQPVVLTVRNAPGPPSGPPLPPVRVLGGGDYRQPGEAVEAGFPSAVTGSSEAAELVIDRYRQFPTRGRRYTLARWIASPENPLTARVMANRIWQHHFGRGIVETASNFGRNGSGPSHPELLDWLAATFVERGWSVKDMHRLIVLSSTYRQAAENPAVASSDSDPGNSLLWKFRRRRLEAEAIRDGILHVSEGLNAAMGGPSVFPPLPDDLADFARYGRTGGLMWEPNESEADARRRSVYVFQRRSLPLPMLAAFDAPVFSESCERRSQTTTPLQALSMMNGYLVHDEAARLAARIRSLAGADPAAQIGAAFEIVLGRPADTEETAHLARLEGSLESLCRVLFSSNEFLYIE